MKRHEEMMAEDENRRIKDELFKTLLKSDPPKATEGTVRMVFFCDLVVVSYLLY